MLVEGFAKLLANVSERRSKSQELHESLRSSRVEEKIERETEALASVQRQLAATGAQGQRAIVEQEIRGLERDHAGVMERLQAGHLRAARSIQLLELRDKLGVINPGELFRALERVEEASRGLAPPDWPRDPAKMDELLDAVSEAAIARTEKATDQRTTPWFGSSTTSQSEIAEDSKQLADAKRGQITLNAATTKTHARLCAVKAWHRTLCEVADGTR